MANARPPGLQVEANLTYCEDTNARPPQLQIKEQTVIAKFFPLICKTVRLKNILS